MTPRMEHGGRNGSNGASASYRVFEDVLALAGSLANTRRVYAADKLETLAGSVREFAGAMQEMPSVRAYVDATAESLEELADYVTQSDLETMTEDAREFARLHPMATLAGTVAVGIAIAQMMQPGTSTSRRSGARSKTTRRAGRSRRRGGSQRTRTHA